MSASLIYVAASTNRFGQAADVSPSTTTIAFGSSKLLAIWHVAGDDDAGVSETLPGHEGSITCVKFLSDTTIVSADDKGVLRLWKQVQTQACKAHASAASGADQSPCTLQWENTAVVQAHSVSISSLCVHRDLVLTGSSDSLVRIWTFVDRAGADNLREGQSLDMKGKYPLALTVTFLPNTNVYILAIAGTDSKVDLWIRSEDHFIKSASLAGHEDWIRCLAFRDPQRDDEPLILASGSQDCTIRLWNIDPWKLLPTPSKSDGAPELSDELLDAFEASLGDLGDAEEGGREVSLKRHILTVKSSSDSSQQFSVTFDALLVGHEAGITSINWREDVASTLTLLSTSTDSSLILWSPSKVQSSSDASASIWINRQRFGDVGGQRLGGFVGGLWAQHGAEALAWGWSGGWRRWRCASVGSDVADEIWDELGAITGHNRPVKGLDWSPDGRYLISAGFDQTTRIHGPVLSADGVHKSWHEIARPQIHGYDLLNAVFIDSLRFASIADEKVIRVFEAPRGFLDISEKLKISQFTEEEYRRPLGANVPPLGLSNKAVGEEPPQTISDVNTVRRPYEGELASVTLWPEVEKIFGHGYESITLGISPSKRFIATACKATNKEHAVVRIYDTVNYKLAGQPLEGHILTVTRIAFSPDDQYVLTVSRDRSWRLFELKGGGYIPIAADKSHGRIIWDCSWTIEGDAFATASRDKTVKIWKQNVDSWVSVATIKTQHPATAVAFAPKNNDRRHLAVGLESGEILIYSSSVTRMEWDLVMTISSRSAHVDNIHRLTWRPSVSQFRELASCSEDGTLRILKVQGLD